MNKMEQYPQYEDEIDLTRLIRAVWNQRGLITGVTLVCILVVGVFNLSQTVLPQDTQVEMAVSFTFNGAEQGKYPDGSPFVLRDITSNAVITKALQRANIDAAGEDVTAALLITPSIPAVTTITQRAEQIANKSSAPETLVAAAEDALRELESMANKTATLRLEIDKLGLSQADAERLLTGLLEVWAEQASRQYGVLITDVSMPTKPFTLDPTLGVATNADSLKELHRQIDQVLTDLRELAGADSLRLDGQTLSDLAAQSRLLDEALISPLRSLIYDNYAVFASQDFSTEMQMNSRLKILSVQIQTKEKLIRSYDDSLAVLNPPGGASLTGEGANNLSPSLDQGFLNQMLKLGGQLGDLEMRKTILQKRLDAVEELSRLRQEYQIISGSFNNSGAAGSKNTSATLKAYVEQQLPMAGARINQLQSDVLQMVEVASNRYLGVQADLYEIVASPQILRSGGVISPRLGLQLALAAILGLMLGIMIALIRSALLKQGTQ
ncbi:hypothetical protein Tel_15420 [Candidatus Tenderia electrophaga]|uniref:Polysaccharide chain length determinant N-terminal domain-containing protein n=1 Tax=Candidatus Tenderia electrophaga TaxID=1748243 RepID=A0A0S2TGZ3_9GAMM|nr:hypothetical protein Tel_15420 [Candidatus Tenderia electrophaga]